MAGIFNVFARKLKTTLSRAGSTSRNIERNWLKTRL